MKQEIRIILVEILRIVIISMHITHTCSMLHLANYVLILFTEFVTQVV